ncbi:hypothetical protein O1L55_21105 [Streptomyces albulus]|nr:hypothetical protein [Streptomyces noursei]
MLVGESASGSGGTTIGNLTTGNVAPHRPSTPQTPDPGRSTGNGTGHDGGTPSPDPSRSGGSGTGGTGSGTGHQGENPTPTPSDGATSSPAPAPPRPRRVAEPVHRDRRWQGRRLRFDRWRRHSRAPAERAEPRRPTVARSQRTLNP